MSVCYMGYPEFHPGNKVVSLVFHPPEIQRGTEVTIISPRLGDLYAVQLPDGELHRWFAGTELQTVSSSSISCIPYRLGDLVRVLNDRGHPPKIKKGMIVKIVKVISQIPFYDLKLENGKYHRWLADFEIVSRNLIQSS
ncbi:hypothetical protein [Desulfosporosinus sp.]|uniref:hypothetical protein n=1 Tax=Desulfosporosinus sp. TaxID=157907 RepID=UPI0025C5C3CD|nr:hypothetical protein [Desulfosporosinus sp.]